MQQQTSHCLLSSDKLFVIVWVRFFVYKSGKINLERARSPIILNNLFFSSHYSLVFLYKNRRWIEGVWRSIVHFLLFDVNPSVHATQKCCAARRCNFHFGPLTYYRGRKPFIGSTLVISKKFVYTGSKNY